MHKVISDWFLPSSERDGEVCAPDEWSNVCGISGSSLERHLCTRDLMSVLLICYRLVMTVLPERDNSDVELLRDFLEECEQRLKLPKLELKHIWYAEQWHDYPQKIDIFKKQDLARAEMCIRELECGEYDTGLLQWQWPWRTKK